MTKTPYTITPPPDNDEMITSSQKSGSNENRRRYVLLSSNTDGCIDLKFLTWKVFEVLQLLMRIQVYTQTIVKLPKPQQIIWRATKFFPLLNKL